MSPGNEEQSTRVRFLPRDAFQSFLDHLWSCGYRVLGPTPRDGAVQWDEVRRVHDLPIGWRDSQGPGWYRLERSDSQRLFEVVNGPDSMKRFVFAPREPLLQIERSTRGTAVRTTLPNTEKLAVLGARSCDLAGLAMQDRILLQDAYADPFYGARREALLTIIVNCTRALPTCFCASMGSGPRAGSGFDLALTEQDDGFVIESGSSRGVEVLEGLTLTDAAEERLERVRADVDACARSQTRRLDTASLPQGLYERRDHPRWDQVASRCLACTNCTMVCPTCFCHTVEEIPDLSGRRTEHVRLWDSCFTEHHGYIHGKNLRPTIKDRYRMWLTHKLATWIDQFGASGCVGCGRCITWCPVGIDLTEELPALLNHRQ